MAATQAYYTYTKKKTVGRSEPASVEARGTEPKQKSNPTSPNSVFSRVTKEMDSSLDLRVYDSGLFETMVSPSGFFYLNPKTPRR